MSQNLKNLLRNYEHDSEEFDESIEELENNEIVKECDEEYERRVRKINKAIVRDLKTK